MVFTQQILMQAIGFAHESSQVIALDRTFEERLGCPDEDLRALRGQIGHTKRPGDEAFAVFVQGGYALLSAEFTIF